MPIEEFNRDETTVSQRAPNKEAWPMPIEINVSGLYRHIFWCILVKAGNVQNFFTCVGL